MPWTAVPLAQTLGPALLDGGGEAPPRLGQVEAGRSNDAVAGRHHRGHPVEPKVPQAGVSAGHQYQEQNLVARPRGCTTRVLADRSRAT